MHVLLSLKSRKLGYFCRFGELAFLDLLLDMVHEEVGTVVEAECSSGNSEDLRKRGLTQGIVQQLTSMGAGGDVALEGF